MPKLIQSEPATFQWVPRKVLSQLKNKQRVEAEAQCLGSLAVHRGVVATEATYWMLTHRPTMFWMTRVGSETDAKQIGELLWSRFKKAVQLPTKAEMVKLLPEWVVTWLTECTYANKFVEPPK